MFISLFIDEMCHFFWEHSLKCGGPLTEYKYICTVKSCESMKGCTSSFVFLHAFLSKFYIRLIARTWIYIAVIVPNKHMEQISVLSYSLWIMCSFREIINPEQSMFKFRAGDFNYHFNIQH